MKAVAVFPASKQISIVDYGQPSLASPTQAKLRMLEVGICGTDREICRFDYGIPPAGQDHLVIGHESLGEVVEVVEAGFETYVDSRSSHPLAPLVESFGAKYIPAETNTIERMGAQVGSVDVIYEATGASRLSFEASRVLGVNGVFIFTGVPGRKAPIEVDTDLIMRDMVLKNQIVYGTVNAGRDAFEAAIRDLGVFQSRWPEAVKSLITGRYPMEEYQSLLLGAPAGIRNVIQL